MLALPRVIILDQLGEGRGLLRTGNTVREAQGRNGRVSESYELSEAAAASLMRDEWRTPAGSC